MGADSPAEGAGVPGFGTPAWRQAGALCFAGGRERKGQGPKALRPLPKGPPEWVRAAAAPCPPG